MSIVHKLAAASRFCAEARQRLKEELGYTCCAGISTGKIGAKLAAEMNKPNMQTTILPSAFRGLLDSTPLRNIQGVGRAMRIRLNGLLPQDAKCGDLRALSSDDILRAMDNDAKKSQLW